jgi:hypothetical protein
MANGGRRTLSEREIWEEAAESLYQADCRVIFALCSFDLLSNHVNRAPGSRIELSIALPPLNPGFQIEGSAIDDYDSGVSLEYRFVPIDYLLFMVYYGLLVLLLRFCDSFLFYLTK